MPRSQLLPALLCMIRSSASAGDRIEKIPQFCTFLRVYKLSQAVFSSASGFKLSQVGPEADRPLHEQEEAVRHNERSA